MCAIDYKIATITRPIHRRERALCDAGAARSYRASYTRSRLALDATQMTKQRGEAHISAVAYDIGFSDLSYFSRTFRRRFGVTPTDVSTTSLASYPFEPDLP